MFFILRRFLMFLFCLSRQNEKKNIKKKYIQKKTEKKLTKQKTSKNMKTRHDEMKTIFLFLYFWLRQKREEDQEDKEMKTKDTFAKQISYLLNQSFLAISNVE